MGKKDLFTIPYVHNKTGNIYFACESSIINSTNSAENQDMILYCDMNYDMIFVREKKEFFEKFTNIIDTI